MTIDQPPPPKPPPPPPPSSPPDPGQAVPAAWTPPRERTISQRVMPIAIVTITAAVLLVGSAIFLFGDQLTGSDPGTIDSYNDEVLSSCDVPPGSTLVRTFVLRVHDTAGQPLRSLSHVYAVPAAADDVVDFYGLNRSREERPITSERACRFSQRPRAFVVPLAGVPASRPLGAVTEAGSTDVVDLAELPAGTRTLLRLRLAQLEEEGLF